MNALQSFVFDDEQPHAIRVIERDGEPWFVAKDVCAVLGIANNRDALSALDDDEKAGVGLTDISSNGVEQGREFATVSEGGLYTLILRSRQATTPGSMAHRFRKWVTGELLPQIRRTGRYSADPGEDIDWDQVAAKVQLVREARLTAGRKAAAGLWKLLGLPSMEEPGGAAVRRPALQGLEFVRQFLDDRTVDDPGARVQSSLLYRDFEQWLASQNGPGMTQTAFAICLTSLGQRKTTSQNVYYLGLRLKHISEMVL